MIVKMLDLLALIVYYIFTTNNSKNEDIKKNEKTNERGYSRKKYP